MYRLEFDRIGHDVCSRGLSARAYVEITLGPPQVQQCCVAEDARLLHSVFF